MLIEIDGEEVEIADEDVLAYVEAMNAGKSAGNRFVFGIHVNHTQELAQMGDDISSFMTKIGGGEVEVQVSVNAKLAEVKDKVMGFTADAVGYVDDSEDDDDWEEDY